MKNALIATLLALATVVSVGTAGTPRPKNENSMDAPRRGKRPPRIPNMPEAAQSPTNEEVGDGDSFGRSVNFLGYAQTSGVMVSWDCTDQIEGTCVVADAETSSGAIKRIGDEAIVRLPARSARSLLCFNIQPFGFAVLQNSSTTRQGATFSMGARWRIESEVLADPALVNQNTGLPFNGFIEAGANLAYEYNLLEPGGERTVDVNFSRTCNAGHLSRRGLVAMGLSESQAREVFRKPITLKFGANVSVSWGNASVQPGIRVYGD